MGLHEGFRARWNQLFHKRRTELELDQEIHFHLELEAEKNISEGMSPEEARRRALIAFGGVEWTRESHRDGRGARWLEEFLADLRYAVRTLRRAPVFAAAGVLTLALGVGANTAIFSAVNAVILQPLPFPDPGRLVMLWEENPEKNWHHETVAPANFLDWKEQVSSFQDAAAYNMGTGNSTLTGNGPPRLLNRIRVTGNFFAVLGVRPQLGRVLRDEETWETGSHVAVLSHRAWRDAFGADPGVVGRTVQLDGEPVQVVGVMPQSFTFPRQDQDLVWQPFDWKPTDRSEAWFRRAHWPRAIARVRPGVTLAQANAQLQTVVERLKKEFPATNKVMGAGMTPLHEFLTGDTQRPLFVLLAAVGLLLLIACANVGNLLLVRAAGRERETAMRLALGAGRFRIVRQALTESLVLSILGGALGLGLGWWGTKALQSLQPEGMLHVTHFGMNWAVLIYVLAISAASGLLFGIAPALWSGRRAPGDALKEGGRSGSQGQKSRRWSEVLVVGEVAIALLLTLGASLLVRSFLQLENVDPGFDPDGVLAVSLELPDSRYDTGAKAAAFYDELLRRSRALPGASDAGAVTALSLTGGMWSSDFAIGGRPPGEYGIEVLHRTVTPDYFRVMRVPLLQGRGFTDADRDSSPNVVIINQALAKQYFRGENPVGQRITFDREPDSTSVWSTIVGVVGNEHDASLAAEPRIESYAAYAQDRRTDMTLLVRTRADPTSLGPEIRQLVSELDPSLAITTMQTMARVRSNSMARDRFLTALMIMFAGVGLLLAIVGVYGVMAQLALRRTREMGIRIALGAQVSQVRWLVVRHGLRLVLCGLIIGTAGALVATRALRVLLYHVAPVDPPTFIAVPMLLAFTGLAASWIPAALAGRLDPATALRAE